LTNPDDKKALLNAQTEKATELQQQQATGQEKVDSLDDKYKDTVTEEGKKSSKAKDAKKDYDAKVKKYGKNSKQAKDAKKKYDDTVQSEGKKSDKSKKVKEELDKAKDDVDQYKLDTLQAEKDIKDTRASIADDAINKLKDYYSKQKQMAEDAINNEKKKLQDAHDAKMKMLEDEENGINAIYDAKQKQLDQANAEEDYASTMQDKLKQQADLQNKIALLSKDTSLEGKKKLADAQAELDAVNKDIADTQKQKQRDDEKQALDDQKQKELDKINGYTDAQGVYHEGEKDKENKSFEDANNALDDQLKAIDKHYDDIINNEETWAKMRDDAINGNFSTLNTQLATMTKNLNDQLNGIFTGLYTAGANIGKDTTTQLGNDNHQDLENQKYDSTQTVKDTNDATTANKYTMTNGDVDTKKGTKVTEPKDNTKPDTKAKPKPKPKTDPKKKDDDKKKKDDDKKDSSHGYKTKSALNLRSKPSYSGSVLMVMPKGAKVEYLGMSNGWAKVKYKGKTGYAGKDYLQKFDTGGYTGDWAGNDGKIAMLHKKENVFDEDDTKNLLDASKILRTMKNILPAVSKVNVLDKLALAGNITTNVNYGDINVTVQGGDKKKSQDIAKEIMNEIKKKGK
jgi:hypothetical protein